MDNDTIWGVIVSAWVVLGAIPIVALQYANHFSSTPKAQAEVADRRELKLSVYWIIGFLLLLLISQSGAYPAAGILWTVVYLIFGILLLKMKRIAAIKLSRTYKASLVIVAIWAMVFALLGILFDWFDDMESGELLWLASLPPSILLAGLFGYRWIQK
jgi:cobalamin synthase